MSANFPHITAATAIVLAVMQMLLLLRAARGRGLYQTGLGDGGNPALLQRIRAHGNLAENAPLFLILLGLVEVTGQNPTIVAIYAAIFILSRFSHALGLSISSGVTIFRLVGVLGTVFTIIALCVSLGLTLSHDTSWVPYFNVSSLHLPK
jgi:uncharacterized membrane protein YecN with MAPEG domain